MLVHESQNIGNPRACYFLLIFEHEIAKNEWKQLKPCLGNGRQICTIEFSTKF